MSQLLIIEQTENLYTVCHIEGTRASDVRRLLDHAKNAMYGMDDPPEEHDPGNDPINNRNF